MIYTQKEMAQATTSFESRFRLAYLSVDFNPTIVFACRFFITKAKGIGFQQLTFAPGQGNRSWVKLWGRLFKLLKTRLN